MKYVELGKLQQRMTSLNQISHGAASPVPVPRKQQGALLAEAHCNAHTLKWHGSTAWEPKF